MPRRFRRRATAEEAASDQHGENGEREDRQAEWREGGEAEPLMPLTRQLGADDQVGTVAGGVIMPLMSEVVLSGSISEDGARPLFRQMRSMPEMKIATTAVALINEPSPATMLTRRTTSFASLASALR